MKSTLLKILYLFYENDKSLRKAIENIDDNAFPLAIDDQILRLIISNQTREEN
jgi:hypothetical protein